MVALKESHLAELGWHEESQPALCSDRESHNDKKGPAWSCECENLIPGHFSFRKLFAFSFTNNAHALQPSYMCFIKTFIHNL